eukprot:7628730-Karenia_brevis.AAC.1
MCGLGRTKDGEPVCLEWVPDAGLTVWKELYGIRESQEAGPSDSALGLLKKRLEKSQLGSKAGGSVGG